VLQVLMSVIVVLAGFYVVVFAGGSAEYRLIGWVLVAIGVLGMVGGVLMRRRRG
jgi:hypothetical protein